MVSTLASGNNRPIRRAKDIVMFPSIVDVAGLNRISRQILTRAAGAICGMVEAGALTEKNRQADYRGQPVLQHHGLRRSCASTPRKRGV